MPILNEPTVYTFSYVIEKKTILLCINLSTRICCIDKYARIKHVFYKTPNKLVIQTTRQYSDIRLELIFICNYRFKLISYLPFSQYI